MTPLAKGDKIVGVPDGAGGWLAVDLVVIENRPRGHGFGLTPWLPNAVTVRVRRVAIPPDVLGGDPIADAAYRERIGAWVGQQWAEKDRLIDELLAVTGKGSVGKTGPALQQQAGRGGNRTNGSAYSFDRRKDAA